MAEQNSNLIEQLDEIDNFFDRLGNNQLSPEEVLRQTKEAEAKARKLDYLIHRVFAQIPEGRELIEEWKQALIFQPTVESGMDKFEAGIREGQKGFIRAILLTIKQVERGK